MSTPPDNVRLLLVGGGHSTVALFRRAANWVRAGVSVTLLNDHPTLYYSGMAPEHVGGVYDAESVRVDLRAWCERSGMRWAQGRAVSLDPAGRTVATDRGERYPYDVAAFVLGSVNPKQECAGRAIPTKPIREIERLKQAADEALRSSGGRLDLAIVGGGAAGVEIALNLSGRFQGAGRPDALRLIVVEPSGRLLPEFPAGMGRHAERLLRSRGVEVRLGATAERVEDAGVCLEGGELIRAAHVLWSTGSTGQPIFPEAGLSCDERGYLRVEPTLQCPSHPELFAAGDCAVLRGLEDLPRIGVHAVKQGPVLRANLDRALTCLLAGRPITEAKLDAFRPYPVSPLILSTGGPEALWTAGPVWLRGAAFLRLKHFVDLRWIRRYQLRPTEAHALRLSHDRHAASAFPLPQSA